MAKMRCDVCNAEYVAPQGLSLKAINARYECVRCGNSAFVWVVDPSWTAVAGSTAGALMGAAIAGPAGALIGGTVGFLFGARR